MQSKQHSPLDKDTPLKLRELRHVLLLAEELHFARAAERAFLSQSAFSRSIAAVEDELGLRLFDRGSRFVRPTPAGERVILRARRLLSSAMDLAQEAAQLRTGRLGDIAIGSGPHSSQIITAPALVRMHQLHPEVRARLDVGDTATLVQHLQQERIALFVGNASELPASQPWMVEPLGDFTAALFCRTEHPLAARGELSLTDLQSQPFASVHIPAPMLRHVREVLDAKPGDEPMLSLECESIAVLREFVLQTDTILLAPQPTLRVELEAGLMRQLRVREFVPDGGEVPLRSPLAMVWLRDRTPTASTLILADLLRQEAARTLLPPSANAAPPQEPYAT